MEILYKNRFEIFFLTLLGILFGSVIFPGDFFESIFQPILFLLNFAAGILLISKNRALMWLFVVLFAVETFLLVGYLWGKLDNPGYFILRLGIYFVFYVVITVNIIRQVWKASFVNRDVIYGLMCGYIALGLLAFFCFRTLEIVHSGSFSGLSGDEDIIDSLLYFSYMTLLTIGYGDISPISPVAQKVAIITGLAGQFYMVIITSLVIEKYIRHSRRD